VYHLELRKFPHAVCRFNQSEQQLREIVLPWVREQWVDTGERKWNVNEAKLTILEGPHLSMPELAMGRGWRNAQRRSEDVTARVLAAARSGVSAAGARPAAATTGGAPNAHAEHAGGVEGGDAQLLADSLGLQLLGLLDAGPVTLARVWQLASERLQQPSAAGALALAERAVRSLLARGLCGLQQGGEAVAEGRADALLRGVGAWSGDASTPVAIARNS
jgi:hypothetical protein